jgi:hypothetical protein
VLPVALSELATGGERTVAGGAVRIIASYALQDSSLCREFNLAAPARTYDGVACRSNGDWILRFVASAEPGGSYATADGTSLVQDYLTQLGAGPPLGPAEERAALARKS